MLVASIDPDLADTAAMTEAYEVSLEASANCVVVMGKRAGEERVAACVVRADTRADVNNVVRRHLDVRKASFLAHDRAVEETGMEYGGITPVGVPSTWPVLVDARVAEIELAIIGSGIRGIEAVPARSPARSAPRRRGRHRLGPVSPTCPPGVVVGVICLSPVGSSLLFLGESSDDFWSFSGSSSGINPMAPQGARLME